MVDPPHPRPYWHVDAKWICGLLLVVLIAVGLLIIGLYRVTERASAQKLSGAIATSLFSNPGADTSFDATQLRQKLQPLYDQGTDAVAKAASPDPQQQAQVAEHIKPFNFFTKETHDQLLKGVILVAVITLVLLGGLIFFSHRYGKLISVGVVLLAASLPGALLFATMQGGTGDRGVRIAQIGPDVIRLVASSFLPAYLIAAGLAVFLLLFAGVLKAIRR
ncbi:MAG TPA: hypothetical protein VMR98_04160 [Candidatus Polarisedimenticolaceae bacterium]|nr:hypothetical protein [Candidatus Polarisedimenticolaceae bacterium]